jgi:hypothetical protein
MVYGLEKFKEYFGDHTNQYVFIGGTACDILMDELGAPFRATKDFDIVLIIEALDASFGDKFWKFIEDGGYKHREKSTGEDQFYRFSKPTESGYPVMIELFSRKPYNFNLRFETGLTPIYIADSIVSLSAILLNNVYYKALLNSKKIIDGYSVMEIETVILFKIKAWIDMKEKLNNGEHVDSRNIKKHKNDIFRLLVNVFPSSKVEIDEEIAADIRNFIEMIVDEMLDLLKNVYLKID